MGAEIGTVPVRYWWARRIALGAAGVTVAVGVSYGAWGWAVERRLARVEGEIRARGEPLELADFMVQGLQADENAAEKYRAAVAARVREVLWKKAALTGEVVDPWAPSAGPLGPGGPAPDKTDEEFINNLRELPLTPRELAAARKVVEANRQTIDLVLEARGMRGVEWGLTTAQSMPWLEMERMSLGALRSLAELLRAEALVRHQEGDEARAWDGVEGILWLGRAARRHPTIINGLVATAVDSLGPELLLQMGPGLKVGTAPGAVARERVLGLARWLLAEEELRADWRRTWCGERLQTRLLVSWAAKHAESPAGWCGPLVRGQEAETLQYMSGYVAGATAASWPEAQRWFPSLPKWVGRDDSLAGRLPHALSRSLLPSLNRGMELHFRGLADRRMAGAALALRVYVADHGGRWPARLAELVPAYLERVPADPFAADGRALAYRPPGGSAEAMLYSVGSDGADDGGTITVAPKAGEAVRRFGQADYLFFLAAQVRRTAGAEVP